MNKLLFLPLVLMTFASLVTQFMVNDGFAYDADGNFVYSGGDANVTTDGVGENVEVEGYNLSAGFTLESGVIALLIAMVAVGVVAGIRVVGSGLSEFSVSVIYKSLFMYALWGLLSLFGMASITAIPIMGYAFYFCLTLVYSIGIFETFGSSGGGD